ncbi:hypothetical protein ABZ599_39660 [Streptomyces misionensis]|uniref:hypothetical protein n=1 Tax=Streptomyces misionensis TaxID=67331 RepID=UPI0033CE6877
MIAGGTHGGALMAFADIIAAAFVTAAPATMKSSTNFLRPVHGAATAEARSRSPRKIDGRRREADRPGW